jgi:DNA-binding NarL/FixJ family response regulator
MPAKIKVLLASRPKMLSDVVRNMLERQPDMEVVGEVLDPVALLLTARAKPVDVVIVTPLDWEQEPRICRHLLAEHPQLKIVTLPANGEAAFLYESGGRKQRFDEPSKESILGAIREAMIRLEKGLKSKPI